MTFAGLALALAVVGGAFVGSALLRQERRSPLPSQLAVPNASPTPAERTPPASPHTTPEPTPTPGPRTAATWRRLGDLGDAFAGQRVTSIASAPGGGFVAFGEDPAALRALVWDSADGIRWEPVDIPATTFGGVAPVSDAVLTDDGMVVVGYDVSVQGGTQRVVWTSPDGRTWTRDPDPSAMLDTDGSPLQLVAGPRGMLAWLTTGRVWSSRDGVTWNGPGSMDAADVSDVLADRDGFTAVGRDGTRVWVTTSANGRRWSAPDRSVVAGDALPGAEGRSTGPGLVWVGQDRWRQGGDGSWAPGGGARVPDVGDPSDIVAGPRGFLAVGFAAPGGAHRAWTWDGQGAWQPVDGSRTASGSPGTGELVGVVPDEAGWTVFVSADDRVTAWRVEA